MHDPAEVAYFPLHRLTHQFASHLIRARKPSPAIYAHVEQQLGLALRRILFFDDVAENVAVALDRGWHAHQIDHTLDDPIPQLRSALKRHGML